MRQILIDAGPIIAILSQNDRDHELCKEALKGLPTPMLTTWPVITEALYLLRRKPALVAELFRMISGGLISIVEIDQSGVEWLRTFFAKYADQSPELGDASLLYIAESLRITTVFTLDRRDFQIYRLSDGSTLTRYPN